MSCIPLLGGPLTGCDENIPPRAIGYNVYPQPVPNREWTHGRTAAGCRGRSGAAGSSAVEALKRAAPDLDVVVIGREEQAPYNRTTVNKGLLTGPVGERDVDLPDLDSLGITWRRGSPVHAVDRAAGAIELADGTRLGADAFVR